MGRFVQDCDSHGSLKDIQILINNRKEILDKKLSEALEQKINITWKSPIKEDQYAEYRDEDFLRILDIESKINSPLEKFWPKRGPQWDALGIDDEKIFLVEAKANLPEVVSPPTVAEKESKSKILDSFSELKEYLNINNTIDWSGTFYQYANRIAHLYFLRVLNGINAYLVNIYFINDNSVAGPKSIDEWRGALTIIKHYLGIPKKNKLEKYMIDIFIDVNDLIK